MKRMKNLLMIIAAALTLIIFITGFDLPKFLLKMKALLYPLLIANDINNISQPSTNTIVIIWLGASLIIAIFMTINRKTSKKRILDFIENLFIVGAQFFIIGLIWNFHFDIQLKKLLIILFLELCIIGTVVYAFAKYVNKIGMWPRDVSTNIVILGFILGLPLLLFHLQIGLTIVIISITLGAAFSRDSKKKSGRKEKQDD